MNWVFLKQAANIRVKQRPGMSSKRKHPGFDVTIDGAKHVLALNTTQGTYFDMLLDGSKIGRINRHAVYARDPHDGEREFDYYEFEVFNNKGQTIYENDSSWGMDRVLQKALEIMIRRKELPTG